MKKITTRKLNKYVFSYTGPKKKNVYTMDGTSFIIVHATCLRSARQMAATIINTKVKFERESTLWKEEPHGFRKTLFV